MRFRFTIFLLLLNVALALSLYWLDRRADARRAFFDSARLILPPGAITQATRISFESASGQPIHTLERKTSGLGWTLLEPIRWPANEFAVNRLLDQLRLLEPETHFTLEALRDAGQTLQDYGLEPPAAKLHIDNGDERFTLQLGQATRMGNRLYLLGPDARRIFVVRRDLLDSLSSGLEGLRSDSIFDLQPHEVRSISLDGQGTASRAKIRLSRTALNHWQFEAPIRAEANAVAVETALTSLLAVRTVRFAFGDPASLGLLNPALRMVLENGGQREEIFLGLPVTDSTSDPNQTTPSTSTGDPQRYARIASSPSIFIVSEAPFAPFLDAQEALRERRFASFEPSDIMGFDIRLSDQVLRVRRLENESWEVLRESNESGLAPWRADAVVVKDLLEMLARMRALRFVSDAPSSADLSSFGFDDPQRRVILQRRDGKPHLELVFGDLDSSGQEVFVKRADLPFVYTCSPLPLSFLRLSPLHFRERFLGGMPQSARLLRVRLQKLPAKEVIWEFSPTEDGSFSQSLANPNPTQQSAIDKMLEVIRHFPVREFMQATFEDPFMLDEQTALPWEWAIEAEFLLPGASGNSQETLRYFFSQRIGATTQFGGSPAQGFTFTLDRSVMDMLETLGARRTPPTIEDDPSEP